MYPRETLPPNFPGRIGYACLNSVLRKNVPSVFCSRTARVATFLKKKEGYLQELGKLNAADLQKMILWNDEHNIHFMRISSGLFPFASHPLYGYSLEFCREDLKAVGDLAKRLGHRLTLHPGQTNNLGSPSPQVVLSTIKDLSYHAQILDLMELDADSVMIIHGGGVYDDKIKTLQRWEKEFRNLPANVRTRIVVENDEVCYSTEELLPLCEKLGIPLVFDWHHHDINPGVMDLGEILARVASTWEKRGIRQKMHYSESRENCNSTVMGRRGHSNKVRDIVMCGEHIDLMIEAKDKEQAVLHIYEKYNIKKKNNPLSSIDPAM